MIRDLGPMPRFVNFFEAICTVEGEPITANQEMVVRLTWMNDANRRKTFLTTMAFDQRSSPASPAVLEIKHRKHGKKAGDTRVSEFEVTKPPPKKLPDLYLGKVDTN